MRTRFLDFLRTPEVVDDGFLRFCGAALLAAGGLFFFRSAAATVLVACALGGGVVVALLWGGFRRLGFRPLGGYWPGLGRGLAVALLVFCVLPPGIPPVLAALLAALAVAVEAVERKALVPLAASGVTVAWLLGWLWQSRTGAPFVAPFDLHALDEPITLWTRFQAAIDPVRMYAGQVAGPLGVTSLGLVALVTLALAYARSVSWHVVAGFYAPLLGAAVLARMPLNVYLLDAPALLFAAVIAGEARRLPRAVPWRLTMGVGAGALAGLLLAGGWGYQAFGLGVAVATALVSVFQFFGLAGAPGVLDHHQEIPEPEATPESAPVPARRAVAAIQVLVMAVFMPVGLVLVLRDRSLGRRQRRALAAMGASLYLTAVVGSLTWLWLLRIPS